MKGILILMRMRRKKHGAERIAACSAILIEQNAAETVDPSVFFPVSRPLHLEIGCGKGDFAVGMAAKHPDCNLIAMERVPDVACIALEFSAKKRERFYDKPLKDLRIKKNCLIACIIRQNEVIIPKGDSQIQLGDNVVVVTTHKNFDDLNDVFV